jgi:hypothetical protein
MFFPVNPSLHGFIVSHKTLIMPSNSIPTTIITILALASLIDTTQHPSGKSLLSHVIHRWSRYLVAEHATGMNVETPLQWKMLGG